MKKIHFLFVSFLFLVSSSLIAQKLANPNARFYNDKNFKYEFEVYPEYDKIDVKKGVEYFWYKSGVVQSSYFDYSGKLLHGSYERLSLDSNQLLEKGDFNLGVKKGDWKYWFPDGKLMRYESWKKGQLHGNYEEYDKTGSVTRSGTYKHGLKHGIWIDYDNKRKARYHKDKIVPLKKIPFWKKIFQKKKEKKNTPKTKKVKKDKKEKKEEKGKTKKNA